MANTRNTSKPRHTETRKTETQRNQRLITAGQRATEIAHDLNNLLTPVITCAELIRLDVKQQPEVTENIQILLSAASRAQSLVAQLLPPDKHDSRRQEQVPLEQTLHEALQIIQATIPPSMTLTSNLNLNDTHVTADPLEVHQVLMNLCLNSAEACRSTDGQIKVEAEIAQPDSGEDQFAKITVSDNGVGISEEDQRKVFDAYYSTNNSKRATGLGLHITKQIVERVGGRISLTSQVKQGTSFQVLLPTATKLELPEKTTSTAGIGAERILFVDDEPLLTFVSKKLLIRLGYQVDVVSSGKEALNCFRKAPERYDLVITDKTMGEIDGISLAKQLKAIAPKTPIILCSGVALEKNSEHEEISTILKKPFTIETLARTLRSVLDKPEES